MYSNVSLLILFAAILANISIYPIPNTDASSLNHSIFSYVQIKSATGSASGSGPSSPNERKRKLSGDDCDSGSSGRRSSRRLRVEEGESTSTLNTLEFLSESLDDITSVQKPEQVSEEQLLDLILSEYENRGIQREEITEEQICASASAQAKNCFKKWKQVKQSLKCLEASLNDLEERQRCCPVADDDEARSYSEAHFEILQKQELVSQIEASLASSYNHFLNIKEKHSKVRRSARLGNNRQPGTSTHIPQQPSQTPSTSSSQGQFGTTQSTHATARTHTRTSQAGRGVTSTRRSRRKRYRRRRRTF
ncbi:uncharacterized protein cubi_03724 [Cryptosporidium ubiquitum]|uniref:Uncharacterized protein n=1 Tax=Cryptosporidium ubiquitum TaxID=857276 RepID=A0A1J4MQS5_9CRYT|nr:uncharacterized protein cubi_03724 [Cryptosporidium ubiquitum]OII75245.1 hypothetical protein cubi_03724 [Cryptosporidium ubiquitum]